MTPAATRIDRTSSRDCAACTVRTSYNDLQRAAMTEVADPISRASCEDLCDKINKIQRLAGRSRGWRCACRIGCSIRKDSPSSGALTHARCMRAGVRNDRLERVFATIRREDCLGTDQWRIVQHPPGPSLPVNDPVYDAVFALVPERGVNNGSGRLGARVAGSPRSPAAP